MPDDYDAAADMRASIEFAYGHIRARVAAGGPGWRGYPIDNEQAKLLMWAAKLHIEAGTLWPKTG